jgi:hypothetical protein
VTVKSSVLWDVAPSSVEEFYWSFKEHGDSGSRAEDEDSASLQNVGKLLSHCTASIPRATFVYIQRRDNLLPKGVNIMIAMCP